MGVAIDGFGNIQVIDASARPGFEDAGGGALFEVNPRNGTRAVISDFNDDTKGPVGTLPRSLAIVPVPLVVDADASPNPNLSPDWRGALFCVDPFTGERTVINDFNDSVQAIPIQIDPDHPEQCLQFGRIDPDHPDQCHVLGRSPFGVAIEGPDSILVIDADVVLGGPGALFRINPSTCVRPPCNRTVICNKIGISPVRLAIRAPGDILIADEDAGTNRRGALLSVNTSTCAVTTLIDFGNRKEGELGSEPDGVAIIKGKGTFTSELVIDADAGTDMDDDDSGSGALFGIKPFSFPGEINRTVLSDFGDPNLGPRGVDPVGVDIEASGDLLVIDRSEGTKERGALFRVNPSTGQRTVISDFGVGDRRLWGRDPDEVTIEASGNILVVDLTAREGGLLFRVNPRNGARRVLSDFNNPRERSSFLGICPSGSDVALKPNEAVLSFGPGPPIP